MADDLPLVYLCAFVGFVTIFLGAVNAVFWDRHKNVLTTGPTSIRVGWGTSLASLLIPYLMVITLALLAYYRFFAAAQTGAPLKPTFIYLALVNSFWALSAGFLILTWAFNIIG